MKMTRVLGLAAIGALLVLAAPSEQASAMSLSSPGVAATVQDSATPTVIEAGWRHGWRRHHWHRWHRHHWRRRY